MVQRRVAGLWRIAGTGIEAQTADWATLYQQLAGKWSKCSREASRHA